MSEVWVFFNQIYIKDENIISKLQSLNCGGWNSVKFCLYQQYP